MGTALCARGLEWARSKRARMRTLEDIGTGWRVRTEDMPTRWSARTEDMPTPWSPLGAPLEREHSNPLGPSALEPPVYREHSNPCGRRGFECKECECGESKQSKCAVWAWLLAIWCGGRYEQIGVKTWRGR